MGVHRTVETRHRGTPRSAGWETVDADPWGPVARLLISSYLMTLMVRGPDVVAAIAGTA